MNKKINFSKIKIKSLEEIKECTLKDNDNQEYVIEVKQYLPQEDKIALLDFVLSNSIHPTQNYFSRIMLETYTMIGIIKFYTNISFTDKQIFDNVYKTYDILETNNIINTILSYIPEKEMNYLEDLIDLTTKDIEKYNYSVLGILNSMKESSTELGDKLNDIISQIKDGEGLELIKQIEAFEEEKN